LLNKKNTCEINASPKIHTAFSPYYLVLSNKNSYITIF